MTGALEPGSENMDEVDFIIAYEGGELGEKAIIEGFQMLIDNGHAWTLQGHYGRVATALINDGFCTRPKVVK
jgi:hypothetical protein